MIRQEPTVRKAPNPKVWLNDQEKKKIATLFVAVFEATFRASIALTTIPLLTNTYQIPIVLKAFLILGAVTFTMSPFNKIVRSVYV